MTHTRGKPYHPMTQGKIECIATNEQRLNESPIFRLTTVQPKGFTPVAEVKLTHLACSDQGEREGDLPPSPLC